VKNLNEKMKMLEQKKSIMGPVISVFVMVLVISILAGLTFLFVSQLKTQVENTATDGENSTAYQAVNDTEAAGATVVGYLPLIFLAVIFGAILTLVLKIILPYINLGQNMGGF
jgi:FlaG/FlaF family flagellin (archaellin)